LKCSRKTASRLLKYHPKLPVALRRVLILQDPTAKPDTFRRRTSDDLWLVAKQHNAHPQKQKNMAYNRPYNPDELPR
jgi:hypothetical protein